MKLCHVLEGYISPWLEELLIPVHQMLQQKYGEPVGEGRNRLVFRSKTAVIKAPKNDEGLNDNISEFHQFSKYGKENPELARVRLIHINNIPLLFMELVDTSIPPRELPSWAGFYDTFQVGKSRKGQWKAYDYA